MNLVKWLRKNNMKVMAFVVIGTMVAFTAGPALQYLSRRSGGGPHKAVAYFGDNEKITTYDRTLARRELEILKTLRADALLRRIALPVFRMQDLRALLLAELLFFEREISPVLSMRIKQTIRINKYRISDKQINDIYRGSVGDDIYWLLLKNEAQLGGVRISNRQVGNWLARIIPQFFDGAGYSQVIGSMVNQQGIPEEEILRTFGKLLSVLEYAKMMCLSEDVTSSQIMHNASWENETLQVEFVKLDSAVFAGDQNEPTQQELGRQFDKYKKFFAGAVSGENPYGFGYKLPDRVQLGYMAVKLDDVSKIVTPPTQEETEEYYQKHIKQFTEQVPSDPNDPNSPQIERTRSYAEVASIISNQLLHSKINLKAERILQEAKTLTEAGFEDIDVELDKLSAEQFRQLAGDYETAAEQLSKKYKIKVYAGQTGLLSAADMLVDRNFGRLYLKGYGYNPVGLTQVVFAIDELKSSELGPFDVAKPRLYENIGPMRDIGGRMMAVVRVIEADKASEPESINQTYSKSTLRFEQDQEQANEDVYSVKEKVAEDLKKLAAMDTTKSKAEELVRQVVKDGWERAVEKFNEQLHLRAKEDESEPNVFEPPNAIKGADKTFKLQKLTNIQRITRERIETLAVQSEGNPAARLFVGEARKRLSVNEAEIQRLFFATIYSLLPKDANSLETVPVIMEFMPDMSYYCLKSVEIKRLERKQYEKIKAMRVYKEDIVQSQNLAPVHFNPENILKRMNFRWNNDD